MKAQWGHNMWLPSYRNSQQDATVYQKFVLFLFPTWYTYIFLFYIYNFSLNVSDRMVHHQENQIFNYTCSLWHRSLGRWCVVHGRIKIRIAEQAKQLHQYKNNKLKLHKVNAAIWYNKLTPMATHDTSTTEGTVPEAACVIKYLILLMMDQTVRNM